MTFRFLRGVACMLVPCAAAAGPPPASLSFEEAVRMSDRVVIGTVQGTTGRSVRLPNGAEISLGIKDSATGLVFTPYRIRIGECLFDKDGSCEIGDAEVLIPGGTVYETVDGRQRLRTWEVAGAAGAPLPPAGDEVLLFMAKKNGRYIPLNDSGARIRVERSSGSASVVLHFASPRFLSVEGRESARVGAAIGTPALTRPAFIESVRLDRLRELIASARQVLQPTSGMRDANPHRANAGGSLVVRQRRSRVRTGQVPERRESPLDVGDDLGSIRRPHAGRRQSGP